MRLTKATAAQAIERNTLTHPEWGQRLSVEQYLVREDRLREHAFSREGMTTWLLVDERSAVLSSCETFRMESAKRGGAAGNSYAVASVLTEPALRGRGYAARMMSMLMDRLREEDAAAQASVLYSDVGASIYGRSGYVARPTMDRVFEPLAGEIGEGVEVIREADIPAALSEVQRPTDDFVIWPTAAQIDWRIERERVYSSLLGLRRPDAHGAKAGGSTMVWTAGLKSGELFILLARAESASELALLVRSARRTAARAGLKRVVLWEVPLPFEWPEGPEGGKLTERDGGLPMICPLDRSIAPSGWVSIQNALWV